MILFHDADGCLNNPDGSAIGFKEDGFSKVYAEALASLGQLLELSDVEHFIINTGRSWNDTQNLCYALKSTKTTYALVEHGSSLWDVQTGTEVDLLSLAKNPGLAHVTPALATIERVQKLMHWFSSGGDTLLANAINCEIPIKPHGNKFSNLTIPIPKNRDGDAMLATLEKLIGEQPQFSKDNFIYHHSRSEGFIDVMGTVDKGIGVELAIRYLGYDPSQTAAIGNGLNDLPMLKKVAVPICPDNAEPEVKSMCEREGIASQHRFIGATRAWLETRV